ncbi:alpha/beta fold hydrolase [Mycobacterium simiae]|uniref:Alpha/beta fold hydrolase n=1 Tax=Mycobacterium simiae TaxID=1784 RepID=A0A5B1BTX5_MYCSI|nr:alpha/beta fold hydrolase [Mycobacterium simiae]KAA1251412.1 alpha/beta fold hydrolase [Mycobacterium simiae]
MAKTHAKSALGEERYLCVGGQRIRVNVHQRTGVPLVLCNGIGASLEVLDPLVEQLDRTVVRFDVPGTGGSPTSVLPYGFPYLAWILGRLLSKLGIGAVDVLGLSWGGALAQQFALQHPRRCRRLVLVATGTGVMMVPGHPRILAKMLTPRRFSEPNYAASIAGELYGGTVRAHGEDVAQLFFRQLRAGSKIGYLHQLLAGSVWTSLFALPAVRQETLIVAGTDDPIIPVANAHIMNTLLPHSRLHVHSGGHIDLVHNATELAPVIERFLGKAGRERNATANRPLLFRHGVTLAPPSRR